MIVGYLRVSTGKQNLANQQDEIRRFAESRNFTVNSWVTEVVSGKKNERERKLGTLLKRMKPGDTLIVTEISRLSRTLTDIMAIMGKCLSREINLYTTKEGYSFDNSINSKVLCFAFGLVAEIERNLISMRTKEALALRKAEGGDARQEKGSYTKTNILMANRQAIIEMLNNDKSIGDICKRFDISRDTFAKFRKRYPSVQKAVQEKEVRRIAAYGGTRSSSRPSLTIEGNSVLPFPSIACMRKTCAVRPCLHCPAPFRICACRVPSAIREPGRGICAGRIRRVWSRVFHARPPSWPAVRRCRC